MKTLVYGILLMSLPPVCAAASSLVDPAPQPGRSLPAFPADGARLSCNPPAFRWIPAPGHPSGSLRYVAEYSADPAFPAGPTFRLGPVTGHVAVPTVILKPGRWYWRYGVITGSDRTGNITWSRSRAFTVPAGIPEIPFPTPAQLRRITSGHPRLLLRPEELPELRRRAANGDLRTFAAGKVKAVRGFAGKPICPEPDYLPQDQSRSRVYAKVFTATRPDMFKTQEAALAYLLTGDPVCGAEAKRRVLHFFSWDPHGPTGLFNNDEPAMSIMINGVRAYDWTRELYTPAERARIETAMLARAADFHRWLVEKPYDSNPYESHQSRVLAFLTEAAVVLSPDHPEAERYLDYVLKIYYGVFPAWGGEDGGWNEWPHYWGAYLGVAFDSLYAIRQALGIDLFRLPFFHHTPYYILYATDPQSRMPFMGDGDPESFTYRILRRFALLYRDPLLLNSARRSKVRPSTLTDLLWSDAAAAAIRSEAVPPPPQARCFPGVGLAAMHTDLEHFENDIRFLFQSSPYGGVSHGHNTQNCFTLEAFGEPLAIPSGYYNYYGSAHHYRWTQETKSACGITVDHGQGQPRGPQSAARLTAFVHGPAFDFAAGNASGSYGPLLSRAVREVVHVRPGIFVMRDDLAAAQPRRFEYNLHAERPMQLAPERGEILIVQPRATLRVLLFGPEPLRFEQTDRFDPPPEKGVNISKRKMVNQYHFRATTAEPVRNLDLISVLLPARTGKEASLPTVEKLTGTGASGVTLRRSDGSVCVVGFAAPGASGTVELSGIRTDARVFAVNLDRAGHPVAWLADRATMLDCRGRKLHRSNRPETITRALPANPDHKE